MPIGPIRRFLILLSQQIRTHRSQGLPASGYRRRLIPAPMANPFQRDERYDMFFRRPPALPLHEKDMITGEVEPWTFFYREGIPLSVRKRMGMQGPQADVPKPISSQRGTANLKAAKTYSPVHRHGRRFPSQGTDQKRIGSHSGSPASKWDGVVRDAERKVDWRKAHYGGSPPKSSYQDPFCFLI